MKRVQKFRSVEEMGSVPVIVPAGEGFERFARQCARYFALAPRTYRPGVFRFRSLAEAQFARATVGRQALRGEVDEPPKHR